MIFTIQNTTNEMHRKLMIAMIRSPIGNTPTVTPEKSSPPMMSEMSGLMISLTSAVTMAVNAPPEVESFRMSSSRFQAAYTAGSGPVSRPWSTGHTEVHRPHRTHSSSRTTG